MKKKSLLRNSDGLARAWIILIIVLSVLVVGGIGYAWGRNNAQADAKAKYDQQVQTLQQDLNTAKAAVNTGAQQGQQTVEQLQAENAQLKKTVDEQKQKITDLEKQLEEAQSAPPTGAP